MGWANCPASGDSGKLLGESHTCMGFWRMFRSCVKEVYRKKGQPGCLGDLIVLEQWETKLVREAGNFAEFPVSTLRTLGHKKTTPSPDLESQLR